MIYAGEVCIKRVIELAKKMLSQIDGFITTSVTELSKVAKSTAYIANTSSYATGTFTEDYDLVLGKHQVCVTAGWETIQGAVWVEESLAPITCTVTIDTANCLLYISNGKGYLDASCTIAYRSTAGLDYSYTVPIGLCNLALTEPSGYFSVICNKIYEHVRFEFTVPLTFISSIYRFETST